MMIRRLVSTLLLLCGCTAVIALPAPASTSGVAAISGGYRCVVRDSAHKPWHCCTTNSLWGAWLRADIYYAPQNGVSADTTHTFVGFDNTTKRWDIVALDRSASYYTRFSNSATLNDSKWIDGYRPMKGRAVLKVMPPDRYSFDLAMPRGRSIALTHVLCTRMKN